MTARAIWSFSAFGIAVLLVGAFLSLVMLKVGEYQEKRYYGHGYEESVDLWSFLEQSKSNCNKKKTAADANQCHEAVDGVVSQLIPARDLLAQETVATSTQGLLWIAGLQFAVGFLTLAFLGWTVWQTRLILTQAEATTNSANSTLNLTRETLQATKDSSAVQLRIAQKSLKHAQESTTAAIRSAEAAENAEKARAYIDIKIIHPRGVDGSPDKEKFAVEATAINYGKAPADDFGFNVLIQKAPSDKHGIHGRGYYVGTLGPGRENALPVARIPDDGSFINTTGQNKFHIQSTWRFTEIWGDRYGGSSGHWWQRSGGDGEFQFGASGPTGVYKKKD